MFKKLIIMLLPLLFVASPVWSATSSVNNPNATETAGQFISDSSITTDVKSQLLMQKDISSLSISVATDKGIVTLEGNVQSEAQKKEVVSIASQVKGVKSVNDKLIIQPTKQ